MLAPRHAKRVLLLLFAAVLPGGDGFGGPCDPVVDCNGNGVDDACDIASGDSADTDQNGIPDECENWALCQTGAAFFDYTPHRADREAEQLAMILTGQLRAPDEEYNRIVRDLALIRAQFPDLTIVVDTPDFRADMLMVRPVDPQVHPQYDALNAFYQVVHDHAYTYVPVHALTFCDTINAVALADIYEATGEVVYAEPDWFLGDGDEITITRDGLLYTYSIVNGAVDCSLGCICEGTWEISVDADGNVNLLWEYSPGDVCFKSCCLPDGLCLSAAPENCEYNNGTPVPFCLGDVDGDGVLENCSCFPSFQPYGYTTLGLALSRHIRLGMSYNPRDSAIRVKFLDLPPPNDGLNGTTMWVGPPREISENPGQVTPSPGTSKYLAATLQCQPYFAPWSSLGTLYVSHAGIVPGAIYELAALDETCAAYGEAALSPGASVLTSGFGDVAGGFDATYQRWPYPDGSADVASDGLAVLDKFAGRPTAPIKARADLAPDAPDRVVDIRDVVAVLDGFRGRPYPQASVEPCP